jgi:perosamine synthetase
MWSRKRIDIGWFDLACGFWWSLISPDRGDALSRTETALFPAEQTLVTLSVRSGFDLLLQTLALPPGSEVLMSSVTITDMARIVEEHGLVPVPVDLDPVAMSPDLHALQKVLSTRSKAIVIAHLFGAIVDLEPMVRFAEDNDLIFIEDCAQAFDGHRYQGHPRSDIVMFSFGPIKTATALAGGILLVRDPNQLQRLREALNQLPIQPTGEFRSRTFRYALLKFVSGRIMFRLLTIALKLGGRNLDETLNGAVRNFPADQFFENLRRQPSVALLKLLTRRLRTFDLARQDRRAALGAVLSQRLQEHASVTPDRTVPASECVTCPGSAVKRHTWWVFPVVTDASVDQSALIQNLARRGFDATSGSQMATLPVPESHAEHPPLQAQRVVERMIFLPFYPELSDHAVAQLAEAVIESLAHTRRESAASSTPAEPQP